MTHHVHEQIHRVHALAFSITQVADVPGQGTSSGYVQHLPMLHIPMLYLKQKLHHQDYFSTVAPAVNAPQRVYNAQLYIQYNKSSLLLEIDIGTSKLGV